MFMNPQMLQPSVQDLQSDVLDLLGEVCSIMLRASRALNSERNGEKYTKFHREVEEALSNVENLELRMAIVAPMKAGKSTIINAMVGQDILPSRNAAMTTLPTKIVFKADLQEPVLLLSSEILSVFQETLIAIQKRTKVLSPEQLQEKAAKYPHLLTLLSDVTSSTVFRLYPETPGKEAINKALTGLNDIIRLCSFLEPAADPLIRLKDVPRIETPFLKSDIPEQSDLLGKLVVIDTPGPNEAGDHLRLTSVVTGELRKSSIVLVVLDFTQLKTEAAEDIRQEVQEVIKLRGRENLYVLVNKVDQRRENDMTPDQVKKFVSAELGLVDANNSDRVFEISAIQAFSAAKFMLEFQQRPGANISELKSVKSLAQEALGIRWEKVLKRSTVQDLEEAADELWEESGFSPFLEKSINALMESAAPRCMRSALNLSRNRLVQLCDDVNLRRSAIATDAKELKRQVEALEVDIHSIQTVRTGLKQASRIKSQLKDDVKHLLKDLSNKKPPSRLLKGFSGKTRNFENYSDAENFQLEVEERLVDSVGLIVDKVREETKQLVEKTRQNLTSVLEKETRAVINRARERLNQAFNIELSFQPPVLADSDIGFVQSRGISIQEKTDTWEEKYTAYVTEYERRWYTAWLWKHEKQVPVTRTRQKSRDYYVVSKSDVINQFNSNIKDVSIKVEGQLEQYIQEDFQTQINAFFSSLDDYFRSYQDSLKQAQSDQQLSMKQKNSLVDELNALVPQATQQIQKAESYIKRTEQLD